jgi:hypothetical protein
MTERGSRNGLRSNTDLHMKKATGFAKRPEIEATSANGLQNGVRATASDRTPNLYMAKETGFANRPEFEPPITEKMTERGSCNGLTSNPKPAHDKGDGVRETT